MNISVDTHNKEAVNEVVFPIIEGLSFNTDNYILITWQNGRIIKNPVDNFLSKGYDVPFWVGRGKYGYQNEYPAALSFQYAAFYGKEWTGGMGANYLRSLFALGFQGFFIMICLAIYTTMMQTVMNSSDIVGAMWSYIAYSGVLLFAIGKTDRISKTIFGAH